MIENFKRIASCICWGGLIQSFIEEYGNEIECQAFEISLKARDHRINQNILSLVLLIILNWVLIDFLVKNFRKLFGEFKIVLENIFELKISETLNQLNL